MTPIDDFEAAAAKVAGQSSGDPMDTAAASVVQGQRTSLRSSLYGALLENPDMAARAQKLGRKTGIPADVVGRNLPEVERNAKLDEFDRVLDRSPTVAQWLTEQNNAKIAHDDVENLLAIEETAKQFGSMRPLERSIIGSFTEPVRRGLAQGRRGLTLLMHDMGLFDGMQRQRDAARAAAGLPPEGNSSVAVQLADQQRQVERFPIPDNIAQGMQEISASKTFSEALGAAARNPRAILETTLQSLGASAPALVGAMAGSTGGPVGTAAGAGMGSFAVEYSSTLQDVLDERGVNGRDPLAISNALADPELMAAAREKALKRGLPVAAFDALTAGLAGRLLAGSKSTVASVASRSAGELVLQAGGGAAGETVAQVVTGEWKPGDILMEALAEIPSAITEVPGNFRHSLQSAQSAEQRVQVVEQLNTLAEASKVRERDADTFEQFIAQATDGAPVQNVYIDANTLMQSGMGDQLAAVSPSVAAQLPTALASGGEIRIPVAEYTARIAGTEYAQGLMDDLRVEGEQFTRREAQEYMQNQAGELASEFERVLADKQGDDTFKASADAVKAEVKAQLDQAGRFTGPVHDAYASLVGNWFAVKAADLDMSPQDLFAKYPLRVTAEGVQGSQVLEQGGQVSDWADREIAPVGSWVKADYKLADSQPVYQVRDLNPSDLYLPELDEKGRLQPEKRKYLDSYTERAKAGEVPPSITVIEMEDGRLRVVDGHRRALAAMAAGKSIRALVSPLVDTPDGRKEATVENIKQLNQSAQSQPLPATIEIDGKQRPTTNSNGQPIAATEEGVRNFWKWFGDSKVVDASGKPLVVYHGTASTDITEFRPRGGRNGEWQDALSRFKAAQVSNARVGYMAFRDGSFFSPKADYAGHYTREGQGVMYPVYVKAENPVFFNQVKKGDVTGIDAKKTPDALIMHTDGDVNEVAVIDPTQIKSAIGNSGEFDPANPNILMQSDSERDLMVTHNLTAANLLHAQKMGGLPVPSLAITKKDTPLTGFGEVTLIGPPEMADPKGYAGTKVFGADIYSPRYPSVSYEFTGNMRKRGEAQVQGGLEATDSRIEWDEVERNGSRELERTAGVIWQFLRERGVAPEVVRVQADLLDPRIASFVDSKLGRFDLVKDDAFVAAAWDVRRDVLLTKYDGDVKEVDAELAEEKARVAERGKFYFASELAGKVEEFRRAQREAGKVDKRATLYALQQQVRDADMADALESYAKQMLEGIGPNERIFQGYTNSGNRKYIPHTIENVVKILKKELRGGESFNYGVGSVRAKFTPQFKNVAQIKKAKGRLITAEQFDSIKDEINSEFVNMAEAMNIRTETLSAIMEDGATQGLARAAKTYDVDLGGTRAEQIAEFMDKLRNLPTAYFEAKILRDVSLSEFKGAVVPENADPKVLDALRKAGVTDVRTYKAGDEAARAAAIQGFSDLFFQNQARGNRGAFNPSTNTITLLKGADLSTFLHESGHFFLEVQFDIASRLQGQRNDGASLSEGEQRTLDDTDALLKWFGIESLNEWYGLDFEEKRTHHEKFARGFEAYLFEGKAPSIELQGLFQRFRAWLLNVYRDLKALNVELTDEVRGVMDRMLATSEQIKLAEQGRSMMPLFTSPEQAGMTPQEFAAYQALGTQATNDAIEDVQARTLRDMQWLRNSRGREVKRLQKLSAELRRDVTIDVRREVLSQPVYRAWQFLTRKITPDDKLDAPQSRKSDPNTVEPDVDSLFTAIAKLGGLNKGEVVGQWGSDPKGKPASGVFGKPVWRREGGLSIDAMAEALGELGYLPLDENGKVDTRDLEERFDSELRGAPVYSDRYDYSGMREGRAGDGVNVEALTAGRFDLVELRAMGLPTEMVDRIQNLKMTGKVGLHPDIVAEMFGFTSGDELVRNLAAADKPSDAIEGLVDARMLELHGELATPEAIERAADQAIHNDARARFVATEANALAKATGQRKILASAARDFAAATIARLKVRNIRPGQYVAGEMRAAKAAQKASESGDLTKAAAEKRNQLVQNYLTKSAYEAQDEVDRGVRYLKKFDSDGFRKTVDAEYADQIDALLDRFDLRKSTSLKAVDKRKSLLAWAESQREQGFEPDIPEDLLNEARRQSYKEMTVEEFRGLLDTVKQIEHLGRLKDRLLTAADNRAFAAVKDEIVTSITDNAGDRVADTRTPTTNLGRALQSIKNFGAEHVKAATWARILDGGKDGGAMWEYLIRSANERGNMETTMRADATVKLSEILAPVFKLGRMGGAGQFFPTINRSLNREARLAIALNVGNQSNLQRLLGGEGWTLEQIRPVLQSLSAAEWQAVQAVWDHFESYRPQIAAKERRVYGKEPTWLDPTAFTVTAADGAQVEMRGGYYPIKYDPAASQRAEEHADAEGAKRQLQGAYTSATTRRSFTKARAEEVNGRPLLYTLAGLYGGVNDVIHDLTWHEWLIDANRIMRSKSVDAAIRNHYGPAVKAQFKSWINDIAEGDRGAQNAAEVALGRLRQGVSAAGLGFNVTSAAMQITGFNQSIVRVGAKWIAKGVAQYIASPIGKAREVVGKSEFMADRSRTQFRELNEIRNRVQDENATMRTIKMGTYFLMMRMQRMVDVPTWLGAYEKAIVEGNGEDRAIALADQAVIDSQGSGMTKDLSAIERGGPVLKVFTVYYSFMNTALNIGVTQSMTAKSKAKLAADLLMLYTVPAVLGSMLKDALTPDGGGDDDEDLEAIARKLAAEQLSYLMGLFVVAREFGEVSKIVTGAEGPRRDYSGPAGLRPIADTFTFAKQAGQGEFDAAFRKASINLLGDFTGLPSAQINRTITGIEALEEGQTDNPAAVLFGYKK